jgi:hypothetical protein
VGCNEEKCPESLQNKGFPGFFMRSHQPAKPCRFRQFPPVSAPKCAQGAHKVRTRFEAMNLWTKPVDQITFDDVDAFCQTNLPESLRLDYKVDGPSKLEKTLCAFANTMGGVVLLGVAEDRATNKPIWPPVPGQWSGMPTTKGILEQVQQIAHDKVVPPVTVEIGNLLDNVALPGHSLLVVRVPLSSVAPHSVDGQVYERVGNTSKPHSGDFDRPAHIDRIAALLRRRDRIEEERERMIDTELDRATRLLDKFDVAEMWASAMPLYPWKDVCTPDVCRSFLEGYSSPDIRSHLPTQRIPGGAIRIQNKRRPPAGWRTRTNATILAPSFGKTSYLSVNTRGLVFGLSQVHLSENILKFVDAVRYFRGIFRVARDFQPRHCEMSGLFHLRIGLRKTDSLSMSADPMHLRDDDFTTFPDDRFSSTVTISAADLLEIQPQQSTPTPGELALFQELAFGFDIPPPDPWPSSFVL